jgi:HSP20 family molecular chaperone IbpA
MSTEESNTKADTTGEAAPTETDSPEREVNPIDRRQPNRTLPLGETAANENLPSSTPKPAQKSGPTPKSVGAATTITPQKPAAEKATNRGALEPQPSLPVSMIVRPDGAETNDSSPSVGELEQSFESALARVERTHRNSALGRLLGRIRALIGLDADSSGGLDVRRMVAFDGFHSDLFDEKRERDRRYGTVYTVLEELNAFLVRLELPRRMPMSSLRLAWELPDEMPDYACQVSVKDGVLTIRAGLPDEACRRLSYVSPSFPSDFLTRIDFPVPVDSYKHRLHNKVLEVILFKKQALTQG